MTDHDARTADLPTGSNYPFKQRIPPPRYLANDHNDALRSTRLQT